MPEHSSNLPSLRRLRQRADDLLHRIRSGDHAAITLVRTHHPGFRTTAEPELLATIGLAEVQSALARMHAFQNWAELQAHFHQHNGHDGDAALNDAIIWIRLHPHATLLSLPYNICNAWLEVKGSSARSRRHNERCFDIFVAAFCQATENRMLAEGLSEMDLPPDRVLFEHYEIWQTKLGLRKRSHSIGGNFGLVTDPSLSVYNHTFEDVPLFHFDERPQDGGFTFSVDPIDRATILDQEFGYRIGPDPEFMAIVRDIAKGLRTSNDWENILVLDPEVTLYGVPAAWLDAIDPTMLRDHRDIMCLAYFTAAYTLYGDGRYPEASGLTHDGSIPASAVAAKVAEKLANLDETGFGRVYEAYCVWTSKLVARRLHDAVSMELHETELPKPIYDRIKSLGFGTFEDELLFDFELPLTVANALQSWYGDNLSSDERGALRTALQTMGIDLPEDLFSVKPAEVRSSSTCLQGAVDPVERDHPNRHDETDAILAQEAVNLRQQVRHLISAKGAQPDNAEDEFCLYGQVASLITEHAARAQTEIEYRGVIFDGTLRATLIDAASKECPDARYFDDMLDWVRTYGVPFLPNGELDEDTTDLYFTAWAREKVFGDLADNQIDRTISVSRIGDVNQLGAFYHEISAMSWAIDQVPTKDLERVRKMANEVGLINMMTATPDPVERNVYNHFILHPVSGTRAPGVETLETHIPRAERRRRAREARKRR